jgi:hypothetical protein
MSSKRPTYNEIYYVILRNMKLLQKPGVLTARPGYKISGDKLIYKPAIVVTVAKKKEGLKAKDKLPAEIGDIPVDVREATAMQLLRAKDPDSFHIIQALGPRELHEPETKLECDMRTGKPLAPPSSEVKKIISPAKGKKTPVKYSAPKIPLSSVQGNITISAYASPDDGYTVLSSFLKATNKELTIGMYDFTSGDLLKDVVSTVKPKKIGFTMVLDHPAKNETANQTDEDTKKGIQTADEEAQINWALDNMSPEVTGEIFPHAYHIKVVVRDSNSFWLSSGNFNVSNQPNFGAKDPKRGSFNTSDRDWHLIVENKELAQLFEAYIQNDFKVANDFQATTAQLAAKQKQLLVAKEQRDSLKKAQAKLKTVSRQSGTAKKITFTNPPSKKGKVKEFRNAEVTVQPLLTPDPGTDPRMYITQIINLIKKAEKSIFIQMQYIVPVPSGKKNDFNLVLQTLSDALGRGLDVRIIVSEFQKQKNTEDLGRLFKLDQVMRHQNRVHNKGIVVDSKKVLVSSQNWSSEGVSTNRDAGLIIENSEIAAFFEEIFMDDWTTRTRESK